MTSAEMRRVRDFRRVFTFSFAAHILDVITTHWRDPELHLEGNPIYQLVGDYGHDGWPWLIGTKVVVVGLLAAAYWWYLHMREQFVPHRPINSGRALIWYSMWDGKPYPSSLWQRLVNHRKALFGFTVMTAIALPLSGVAALYFSVDNIFVALDRHLPFLSFALFVPLSTIGMFIWWYLAYWQYYQATRQQESTEAVETENQV